MSAERQVPVEFLRTAFAADDSIGVLLKTYSTGQAMQRIVPVTTATGDRFQAWLRHLNAQGWNVYIAWNRTVVPSSLLTPVSLSKWQDVSLRRRAT